MLESYEIEQSLNARNFAAPINISLCYTYLGDYNNAQQFLRESVSKICGDDCGLVPSVHIKYASGCIFLGLKQYAKAEADFLESSVLSKEIGDHRMQLANIYMLAKISIEAKDFRKAQTYLEEGENFDQH